MPFLNTLLAMGGFVLQMVLLGQIKVACLSLLGVDGQSAVGDLIDIVDRHAR